MRSLGAVVWQQTQPGMGNARREALRHALDLSCQAIVWIEPEKYPMVPLLHAGVRAIVDEGFDLAMFRRLTLDSYPPEQAMAYKMAGLAFQYLYGFDCDYGFGPLCMSPRAATEYFLSYHGEYGDVWDSIHIPKLRMIVEGQPFTIIDVDYRHPPEQTEAETGVELFMKRVEQISQITDAVFRESQRLQA